MPPKEQVTSLSKFSLKMINELIKFYYRITNKEKYYDYRIQLRFDKKKHALTQNFNLELSSIRNVIKDKNELNFKHSGHLGDLLYALPVIKELSKTKTCNLFIELNAQFDGNYHKHPSGNTLLSERSYNMLYPLLKEQNYLNSIKTYSDEAIDINLDLFRKLPCSLSFHSIRWYFQLTGIQSDLNLNYLTVTPHKLIKNKIVIVRTFRARNPFINYGFLKDYNELLFLGTKDEYEDLKKTVPNMEFYDPKDFLEMAEIIKASKFYLSNQTFAYAVAEGLKVPRLLEANPDFPVVFPIGGKGNDFYFQEQFEELFKQYAANPYL